MICYSLKSNETIVCEKLCQLISQYISKNNLPESDYILTIKLSPVVSTTNSLIPLLPYEKEN